MSEYPATYAVKPLGRPLDAVVSVPGSKSITNRAIVLAALASRTTACTLTGALQSEDTEVMVAALQQLGFRISPDWSAATIVVDRHRSDRVVPADSAELFLGNSGTSLRFLTAVCALAPGTYRLDGVPRMRERPAQDLLDALAQLGIDARSEAGDGCPPIVVAGNGRPTGNAKIRGDVSSQFLSALRLVAGFSPTPFAVELAGSLVSEPYVRMTERMVEAWGSGLVKYQIEPDASSASYFLAAPAIVGGAASVTGLPADSLQGDVAFVDCLQSMGCRVTRSADSITVRKAKLVGIDVDMNAISDTVMTLAAVACFADGATTIRNVAHIRHKETDRIKALATELQKLGPRIDEFRDGLRVSPQPMSGRAMDTYNDHRMAMSLALIGLKVPGIVIRNPGCVAKTYPDFWRDFEQL